MSLFAACSGQTIGPAGGRITIGFIDGSFTLRAPPGALEREVRLTAVLRRDPISGAASPVVELGPSGTTFHKPVELAFTPGKRDVAEGIPWSTLQVGTITGGPWEFLPTSLPAPGVIQATTTHFSAFALVARCRVAGTATDFQLTGCPVFDPRIRSSVPVTLDATAASVTLRIWLAGASGSGPVDFTVSGLTAGAEYFLHVDRTGGPTKLVAAGDGSVRFLQDVSADHVVLLSALPGSVALSASTCIAPLGNFDAATKTCSLTRDIPDANVSIVEAGLTLDCRDPATGQRHRIGSGAKHQSVGVFVFQTNEVGVKNCDIVNVDFGTIAGQSFRLRAESTTANGGLSAAGVPLGACGFDQAGGGAASYTDIRAENFRHGINTSGVDDLVVRRAFTKTSGFPVGVFSEKDAILEDVTLDGTLSGRGPSDPAASVPSGAVQLSGSKNAAIVRLKASEMGAFAAAVSVLFDSTATIRGGDITGARSAIRLDGPSASEVTDSTLAGNRLGLQLAGAAHQVFHNNVFGNTERQVTADRAIELSETRAGSPTFQQGNFWGRRCPAPPFIAGVDSNRADTVDSFPFEEKDGWLLGKAPGCPLSAPVISEPLNGETVRAATPTIVGLARAGDTVVVRADGATIATAVAASCGDFKAVAMTALGNGPHIIEAVARVGTLDSVPSPPKRITVDTVAPPPPRISVPGTGMRTFDSRVTIAGSAEPLSVVTIFEGATPIASAQVSDTGDFFAVPQESLSDGTHRIHAVARDVAGNRSAPSSSVSFIVASVQPGAPILGSKGLLSLTAVSDAPDPFHLDSPSPNVLSVSGEVAGLQGIGGGAKPLGFTMVVRRRFVDPRTGRVAREVTAEVPVAAGVAGARRLSVSADNTWDGRDGAGLPVAVGTYAYSVEAAVLRVVPGEPQNPPDCRDPFSATRGPCVVDFTAAVFGTATVLDLPQKVARRVANCPKCEIIASTPLNLPDSGFEVTAYKLMDPTTDERKLLTLAANVAPVSTDDVLLIEEATRRVKFGSLTPELAAKLQSSSPSEPQTIGIWARYHLTYPDKDTLDPAGISALAARVDAAVGTAFAPVACFLQSRGHAIHEIGGSPLIRATVPTSALTSLARHPSVALVAQDGWPGSTPQPTGTSGSSTAWHSTVRAFLAGFFSSGDEPIGINEGCQPDDYSKLVVEQVADPQACTYGHSRQVAMFIRNTGTPPGVNPGARIFVAAGYFLGSGLEPDAEQWMLRRGVRIVNWSYLANLMPGGLGPWDMKFDFLIKNPPFPLWVSAAGNAGDAPSKVTVGNRAMNALIVGGSDDRGTTTISDDTIANFSSWGNPPSTFGDYELPHLVAPAVALEVAGVPTEGTSMSTPMVSGSLGYAYARDPSHFQLWPEAARAVAMATAVHGLLGQPPFFPEPPFTFVGRGLDLRQGGGLLHTTFMTLLADPLRHKAPGSPGIDGGRDARALVFARDFDPVTLQSNFAWNLVASVAGQMRVVIAFDSTAGGCNEIGNYCGNDFLDADLDVFVRRGSSGPLVCGSFSYASSWEGCEFEVKAGEGFTVRLLKWFAPSPSTFLGIAWWNWTPGFE